MVALTVCAIAGCPTLVERGGMCPPHRAAYRRASDRKRPNATDRGYDTRWRRTRAAYLRFHRRCEHPGCTRLAVDVHHLDGQGPNGPRGHDPWNLQALCSRHHKTVTAREQPGGWAAR